MNLERIVALKPDLVLARRGGNAEQVNQLSSLGITVKWVDAVSIEQGGANQRDLAPFSPTLNAPDGLHSRCSTTMPR